MLQGTIQEVDAMGDDGMCPFTDTACQPLCWLWDFDGVGSGCCARSALDVGDEHPRDFYNACLMEAMQ
jgi:hypothetical protein